VPVVHDAVQTLLNGQSHRTLLPAATLICCVALLGGCGGSGHPKTVAAGTTPSGVSTPSGVGQSIRLDNCTNWRWATLAQRRETVAQLRKFAGGPVGSSGGIQRGPVLSDGRAYKLFQSYCSKPFARGFKLYKLYTHAAAFVGH
jgi:hypothetical protein